MPSVAWSFCATCQVALGISEAASGRTGYCSRGPNTWNWLSHGSAGGSGTGARGWGAKAREAGLGGAGGGGGWGLGEEPEPGHIERRALASILHPDGDFHDVLRAAAGRLDDAAHVVEHEAALCLDGFGRFAGGGVVALDAAAFQQRAGAAARRDRVLVAKAGDVHAGARGGRGAPEGRGDGVHSAGMLACSMTGIHRASSCVRNSVNCPGELPRACAPSVSNLACTALSARIFCSACDKRSTIAGGVARGARMPVKVSGLKSLKPAS